MENKEKFIATTRDARYDIENCAVRKFKYRLFPFPPSLNYENLGKCYISPLLEFVLILLLCNCFVEVFPSLALYMEVIVSPLSFFAFSYPDLPILLFGHHFVLNRAIKWSAASKQEVSVDRQLSWKPLNEKPLRTRLGFPQTGRHIVLNRAITWSAECQKFH